MVAGGLAPDPTRQQGINDLDFLDGLYAAGAANYMPIVSVRLPAISYNPLKPNGADARLVLRHYEQIRAVMEDNGHTRGLIWVTSFSWDAETATSSAAQAVWLNQAFELMRAQLYIGAAFFDSLNPSQISEAQLLLPDGSFHPGFDQLILTIAQQNHTQTITLSIRLTKQISGKSHIKTGKP